VFLYRKGRERTELGLGSYPATSLARAREIAVQMQAARAEGLDPKQVRDAPRSRSMTFGQCVEAMLSDLEPGWSSTRYRYQYRRSLTVEARALADTPIAKIDTESVLQLLKPLWLTAPDGAARLRLRIENLLDWAKAKGYREGENPARWRGHLKHLLHKSNHTRTHYAAMPYQDVPAFLTEVRDIGGYGARALELLILTAARSNEVIGARWDEFDLPGKIWTIPAHRMKARREHRVPLSDAALKVLAELAEIRRGEYLVPSWPANRHASHGIIEHVVKRALSRDCTMHGFRSSFRDWASERTSVPREVIETALAHVVGNAAERAYARSDLFERRRHLMALWAEHCTGSTGKVIVLTR
jgi:integrase